MYIAEKTSTEKIKYAQNRTPHVIYDSVGSRLPEIEKERDLIPPSVSTKQQATTGDQRKRG